MNDKRSVKRKTGKWIPCHRALIKHAEWFGEQNERIYLSDSRRNLQWVLLVFSTTSPQ